MPSSNPDEEIFSEESFYTDADSVCTEVRERTAVSKYMRKEGFGQEAIDELWLLIDTPAK